MKIGISTRGLFQGSYAISTIVLHLTNTLIEIAGSSHEFILYFNEPSYEVFFPQPISKRSVKLRNRFFWDQFWLPNQLKRDHIDVAFFFKGTMPAALPSRGMVMFHDMGYFDNKIQPYRWGENAYMKVMIKAAAQKACSVFAVSNHTRTEAIRILGIKPDRIITCYEDCSPEFIPVKDTLKRATVKEHYNLPDKFIFCPVSLSPSKNVPRILKAYNLVKDTIPQDIVFTGGRSWRSGYQVRAEISNNHRIHILGHVESEDMPVLYSLADFTLYPSVLEGFGMPVLEAFRCDCPVLTSNIASLTEVAGNAAYLVDPYDENQIAEGIVKLATDQNLRISLIAKGRKQANNFSWERTARIILTRLETCFS